MLDPFAEVGYAFRSPRDSRIINPSINFPFLLFLKKLSILRAAVSPSAAVNVYVKKRLLFLHGAECKSGGAEAVLSVLSSVILGIKKAVCQPADRTQLLVMFSRDSRAFRRFPDAIASFQASWGGIYIALSFTPANSILIFLVSVP